MVLVMWRDIQRCIIKQLYVTITSDAHHSVMQLTTDSVWVSGVDIERTCIKLPNKSSFFDEATVKLTTGQNKTFPNAVGDIRSEGGDIQQNSPK